MTEQSFQIKCQQKDCRQQAATGRTLRSGEKVLSIKNNRHHGQIHTQELSLDKLIKRLYTQEEILKLYEQIGTNEE